jgi:multidrug resistance efflux pump
MMVCGGIVAAWRTVQSPATFVGQVEVVEAIVSSRDDGIISNLWVVPMQEVKMGDLVAEVVTTDPRTVNNRLEVMRDKMRLIQLEMAPVLDRQRGAIAFEQLGVDSARVKTELEMARVNLEQAGTQLDRATKSFKEGLIPQEEYEIFRARAKVFKVEVAEKEKLVDRSEKALERLKFMADQYVPGGENDPLRQALAVQEEQTRVFEAKVAPLQLTSPTNGIVTVVHHHRGEQVLAGQAIATITMSESPRIIGYLPQDFPFEPCVGAEVQVRTRDRRRRTGRATIVGISPHLQSITNALVPPIAVRPVPVVPLGRIVSISMPRELKLLPGQPVDVTVLPPVQAGSRKD